MIASLSLERRLQICLAAVAALGTLLLGLGQSSVTLPVVAVFAAVTSVYFTDHLGWFRLHRHVANLCALGAVGFVIMDFIEQDSGTQLIAIANLLIYLQIILLYQRKNLRVYWHILVLSLLQVVVAAALNLGIEFGVLLIIYMFLALVTLALLFILCETAPYGSMEADATSTAYNAAETSHGTFQNRVLSNVPGSNITGRRGPGFSAILPAQQPAESMLTRGLVGQIGKLGATTILLTFLVFFLTPRFGNSSWRGGSSGNQRLVGFSQEVALNDIGRVLESPETVMRVQYVMDATDEPYEIGGDFYLRGSVLADYRNGRWTALRRWFHGRQPLPVSDQSRDKVVRQTILLEEPPVLFSVMPAVRVAGSAEDLYVSPETGRLTLQSVERERGAGEIHYVVGTTAFRDGRQRTILPRNFGTSKKGDSLLPPYRRYLGSKDLLPKVAEISAAVIAEADVDEGDRVAKARALEAYLQRDLFSYTLEQQRRAPFDVDPIEFFLTEYREGHCEYFASALALMLRCQGIPARLVVGYRGGEYNRVGHYYVVRQLHAHAWVEAFLEPEHIPSDALLEGETSEFGAWIRLDPTPVDSDPILSFPGSQLLDRLGQYTDYVQVLWNDYILGMDPKRQREAIYQPLMDRTLSSFTDYLLNGHWWQAFGSELVSKMGVDSLASFQLRWFNWHALPAVFGIGLLMVATYLVLRRPVQRVWKRVWGRLSERLLFSRFTRRRKLDFYFRFEKLLRRYGMRREPGQTPRELALSATQLVSSADNARAISTLSQNVVDLYYRVRYGGHPLDTAEAKAIEQKVAGIERLLLESRRSRKRSR